MDSLTDVSDDQPTTFAGRTEADNPARTNERNRP